MRGLGYNISLTASDGLSIGNINLSNDSQLSGADIAGCKIGSVNIVEYIQQAIQDAIEDSGFMTDINVVGREPVMDVTPIYW